MIVLTGASGGIGQAILPLLKDVIPIYNSREIKGGYKVDLTNPKEIKEFAKGLSGKITLVHLAGLKIDELAVFCNEENWDKVMDVNLKGNFLLTKALLTIMTKEKWGRIIHIISSGLGDVGTLTYSTSKFALVGMSQVLAREYVRYGITSNVLQLGYFETGMWHKLKDEKKIELLNQIPNKELGNPQNIVNAIDFIIKSEYVNGSVIQLDGGI